jgi:hypothetical protein
MNPVGSCSYFRPHTQPRSSPSLAPHSQAQPTRRAGLPTTSPFAGTSRVTTAPAPTNACAPIVNPHTTTTPAPSVAPTWTSVGRKSSRLRLLAERGRRSFVNRTPGPRNTSSSMITPSNNMTPFFTVTRLPIVTPPSTYAWSQILQLRPTSAPARTCANAQIRVPAPTWSVSHSPCGWTMTPFGTPESMTRSLFEYLVLRSRLPRSRAFSPRRSASNVRRR